MEEDRGPAGEGGVAGCVGADLVVGEAEVASWRMGGGGGEGVCSIRIEEDEEKKKKWGVGWIEMSISIFFKGRRSMPL